MRDFAALFKGRDDAYGVYTIPAGATPSQRGKLAGIGSTKHEPVTPELYADHLSGQRRLGIVPIRPDNSTLFVALDADVYKSATLHSELSQRIAKLQLPLCVTKSKSGGAHVWLFFRDPVPASKARKIATELVAKLHLDPKTEIFPKQDTIREQDDGSWINLPYFGDSCVGLNETGTVELTLPQFLEYADVRISSANDLMRSKAQADEISQDDNDDAPPCVATMLRDGVEEPGRNNSMVQLAVYFSRAFPDDWQSMVMEAATTKMYPPLSLAEASKIIQTIKNKQYQYLCKQQPMQSLCDKDACVKRKFGVGGGTPTNSIIVFDHMKKIDGEEPIYQVIIDGRKITCDGATLKNYELFRIAAMKRLDRMLPEMPRQAWGDCLNRAFHDMTREAAPVDTQTSQLIVKALKEWCNRAAQNSSPDVIEKRRVPYYNDNSIYFNGDHFLKYVDRNFKIERNKAWVHLREWGVMQDYITIGEQQVMVWRYVVPVGDDWFQPTKRDKIQ
jgi:hypothetical protein